MIGTVPSQPSKPALVSTSSAAQTIQISWIAPSYVGGSALTDYYLWIDDGAGTWPVTPIDYTILTSLQYTFPTLTVGLTYSFKIQAVNAIGTSSFSDTSYFVCADLPGAPAAPVLETSTNSSITLAWNAPASTGGTPITGYRVYINDLLSDIWNLAYDGSNYPSTFVF